MQGTSVRLYVGVLLRAGLASASQTSLLKGLFGLLKTSWKASEQLKPLSEKPDRSSASGTLPPALDACYRWGMERAGAQGPNSWLGHLRVAWSFALQSGTQVECWRSHTGLGVLSLGAGRSSTQKSVTKLLCGESAPLKGSLVSIWEG